MTQWVFANNVILNIDQPFTMPDGTQYPANWLRFASVNDIAALGLTEVIWDPMPDQRYGTVNPDPNNPGKWLYTLFDANTMQLKLTSFAASQRYNKETGGITIANTPINTDRSSQAMLTGAYNLSVANPNIVIQWKAPNGTFVSLDANTMIGIATAVGDHVQACFALEQTCDVSIANGSITTFDQVTMFFASANV